MSSKLNVVILAAGKGTRMYSQTPKVLHELAGRSLVEHVIATAAKLKSQNTTLVIGHQAEKIQKKLSYLPLNFVFQAEQKGTAHAVEQAFPMLDEKAKVLVLYGDVPLIKTSTLKKLLDKTDEQSMAVLTCDVSCPEGLGRIIRDIDGQIRSIVEEKDADAEQRKITEINTGIMAFPVEKLKQWLPRIQNSNAQKEYYLTDIVELCIKDGCKVNDVSCDNELEASGVNNMLQLATLERAHQIDQAHQLMIQGVKLFDPSRFDCRGELEADTEVQIDINVIIEGKVKLGKGVCIGPNCIIKNCSIEKETRIEANSVIEDASIGSKCSIGPFARIRPGPRVDDEAKIGNFVETKKAHIGKGSKVNHLSYVGDTQMGSGVNIGAGTITCNYDGVNKFQTIIGDNVFIGSNSALIAPVKIANGVTVGAGSIVTKNAETGQLVIARSKQTNIDGWKRPQKNNRK
jgi:bifunctional UDP-N-acetylglucosamine pyrophosphorylase/glucosamine-1-phosphate N-acetyltransferase